MKINVATEQKPSGPRKIETVTTYTIDFGSSVTLEQLASVLANLRAQHVPKSGELKFSRFRRTATITSRSTTDNPFATLAESMSAFDHGEH